MLPMLRDGDGCSKGGCQVSVCVSRVAAEGNQGDGDADGSGASDVSRGDLVGCMIRV
jgi:hypothetical protein